MNVKSTSRIQTRFEKLKAEGRGGLITFLTAGDPNLQASREILFGLADAGADFIGDKDMVDKVKAGWTDFDVVVWITGGDSLS